MTDNVLDIRRRALLKLSSLRGNVDRIKGEVEEKYVTEFDTTLDSLEAIGVVVAEFRIPDWEKKRKEACIPTLTFDDSPSSPTYYPGKYVDKPFF